ncbi:related to TPO4 - Proposed vacuolar polyamine transporter [Cephalotrichum gorgonifer]|uniref:Related to TPO4 - Proposed vacuolar polyamine transporter n=1 Tax=Cephalotrichum gorgonifer TaxID=2041049 RepID=A0AAE8N971_9PEZI|nr:related to TPO4 - Proposed vacuolar polyamine transporter [Cephalotrichum gorgonifer]
MTTVDTNQPRLELGAVQPENGVEETGARPTTDAKTAVGSDPEAVPNPDHWDWDSDPHNPYNWPNQRKFRQLLMLSTAAFTAPIIGSFVVARKGWRWTQWTLIFFAVVAILASLAASETYHPNLKRRRAKQLGLPVAEREPLKARIGMFLTIALLRPLHMMFTEPIVGLICLYVACEFATLFTFFAAVPFIFRSVYDFSMEQQGLVFISIVVGCILGAVTVLICNVVLYLPRARRHPPREVPPEYRLYPAMIGSVGLPVGLFWLAWTARKDISWASPTVAIAIFAWGNLCVFVATIQYITDVYIGSTVASAGSANSLARYGLAGAFPLFAIQLYTRLGISWATSLLGFIALALLPVPWAFFRWGKALRRMSKYETAQDK